MPPRDSLYPQDWFRLAARDFKRVEHLLNVDDPEGAGYHRQQAAEKYLKGSAAEAEQFIQRLKGLTK